MTQNANNTPPTGRAISERQGAAYHPSREALIRDLESVEDACEKMSFLAGAEVFKMEQLPHKLLPDMDAYWVMGKVYVELTQAMQRLRATYEAAGMLPPDITPRKGGPNGRSPMR